MGKGYQAHETYVANFQMYFSLIKTAFTISLIIQIIFLCSVWHKANQKLSQINLGYTNVKITQNMFFNYCLSLEKYLHLPEREIFINDPSMIKVFGQQNSVPVSYYRSRLDSLSENAFYKAKNHLIRNFRLSFWAYLIGFFIVIYFIKKSKKMSEEKFVRGVKLIPESELNEKLNHEAEKENITHLQIGKTKILRRLEPYQILILGAIGSGKSVLLNQILHQINVRKTNEQLNDKAIVYDMKGEFIAKQFQPDDMIFSPFDRRSVQWRFFNEIETYPDFDIVANSLYVPEKKEDEYWYNCAKDVFRSGLVWLYQNDRTTNRDIVDFFAQSNRTIVDCFSSLAEAERGAIKHIDKSDSNTSASIISILQQRLQFFRYLVDMDGDFSFRKYIRDENQKNNLYLLNIEQYADIFRPLMTFAVDTLIRETISLSDNRDRRIFFIIDELGRLYKIESIMNLLTIGRSKGGSLIVATQDLGRIKNTYGQEMVETFYNGFNTNFIFRINEPNTADFLSKAIGEKEVIKKMESRQMSPSDWGDRTSITDQEKTERIILGTEFQNFKDFEAIIRISNFGISKITIPRIFYPEVNNYFEQKEFEIKTNTDEVIEETDIKPKINFDRL